MRTAVGVPSMIHHPVVVATIVMVVACSLDVRLQTPCDSLSQMFSANTRGVVLMSLDRIVALGDTVDLAAVGHLDITGRVVPSFTFDWQDGTARFHAVVEAFARNGRWLMFDRWCNGKCWNWSAYTLSDTAEMSDVMLSAMSRTRHFVLTAGDVLSVDREWTSGSDTPATGDMPPVGYRWGSARGVWMTIEVVDGASNLRIALLDSVRVMLHWGSAPRQLQPHTPSPPYARRRWVAPTMTTTTAFIRVNVSSSDSPYPFYRCDDLSIARWGRQEKNGSFKPPAP